MGEHAGQYVAVMSISEVEDKKFTYDHLISTGPLEDLLVEVRDKFAVNEFTSHPGFEEYIADGMSNIIEAENKMKIG